MAYANIKNKKRLTVLLLIVILGSIIILGRLFFIQIIKGSYYKEKAYSQQTKDRQLEAARGIIYDSNGEVLALSVSTNTLTFAPTNITKDEKAQIAQDLAQILNQDAEKILAKLDKRTSLITVATDIERDQAQKISEYIASNDIAGMYLDEDTKRVYPYGNTLSHVLGFVGTDNQGLSGIEALYEEELTGIPR
jgi:stage V sporulation protein D (sporulation-specific penicillin-binding protein)